ncbi:MAG: hypothetical protein Hyperionvirus15_27 [Hyperionvirus sp.]|uniref:Uncharacterized protein n=1 Tax=Hyperionvirus sp. TaxID=2487770 RepID=A0A3G5AF38_9VIRU|nr:MAG: hypothetical protein Hyperionvirus15_27 [Hyperionvirus sp.]
MAPTLKMCGIVLFQAISRIKTNMIININIQIVAAIVFAVVHFF